MNFRIRSSQIRQQFSRPATAVRGRFFRRIRRRNLERTHDITKPNQRNLIFVSTYSYYIYKNLPDCPMNFTAAQNAFASFLHWRYRSRQFSVFLFVSGVLFTLFFNLDPAKWRYQHRVNWFRIVLDRQNERR